MRYACTQQQHVLLVLKTLETYPVKVDAAGSLLHPPGVPLTVERSPSAQMWIARQGLLWQEWHKKPLRCSASSGDALSSPLCQSCAGSSCSLTGRVPLDSGSGSLLLQTLCLCRGFHLLPWLQIPLICHHLPCFDLQPRPYVSRCWLVATGYLEPSVFKCTHDLPLERGPWACWARSPPQTSNPRSPRAVPHQVCQPCLQMTPPPFLCSLSCFPGRLWLSPRILLGPSLVHFHTVARVTCI